MEMDDHKIFIACAQAAHEANRAFCLAHGDTSQVPWHKAPDWQRNSCIRGVGGVLLEGNGPKQSHESWLEEKSRTGWVYGETKDPILKRHPCMVPYEVLSEFQRKKDDIFVDVVRTMAAALGFFRENTRLSMETIP